VRQTTPEVRRLVAAAAVAVLALVGVSSCEGDGDPQAGSGTEEGSGAGSSATPTDPGAPLASFDTSGLVVARAPFCDRVSPTAVETAVAGRDYDSSSYDNGERARLTDDVRDVAHEYGCRWSAGDLTARAWVFAPPIGKDRARAMVRAAPGQGCSATRGVGYGAPSFSTRCRSGKDVTEGYFGLFGDAWLSCTLTAEGRPEPPDLTERADHWCVAVAQAAADSPAP